MSDILDRIVARKHEEVAQLRRDGISLPEEFAEKRPAPPRGFRQSLLSHQGLSIIAEAKKASPSKGLICEDFDPVAIAKNYERCGVQAISVLTDRDFFQGDLRYLLQVREAVGLPVLRKDFIIDELQLKEASLYGADAILLIAAILDEAQLRDYRCYAEELGMDSLVEVHDEEETEKALASGCNLLGVNNRNLKDFSVDVETTFRIRKMVPIEIPLVSESGLKEAADLRRLAEAGVCAALIGETLMRMGSAGDVLAELWRP
ncbi:indole-3-glycerol phosphate synthase TrpC [Desulfotalea psychrophila]|uniref:Indole-3-glycerol phosphate synthase n=1 Tax=Desulfotalea psychrophila (strain LSv54 / DSM 12343) TaxID=177439 RepID=TRPC_DESPS|nr:indole-3-glycerol phosphate synthase TrpC [Desulfotalea psychrophila]Q6AMS4.1 RecName: Full=Indole-3-glycerol phosphate synthase; Short=IGPS [Desulfotalea psychrophila LSv54]CAG36351.1 probable indole-3-glycerol phosphate synthase [Desulfotalea psychrophila LSv54]